VLKQIIKPDVCLQTRLVELLPALSRYLSQSCDFVTSTSAGTNGYYSRGSWFVFAFWHCNYPINLDSWRSLDTNTPW